MCLCRAIRAWTWLRILGPRHCLRAVAPRARMRVQVSYFYDPDCYNAHGYEYGPTAVYYGYRHPMKPHRITMTHSLLMSSGYWPSLQVRLPDLARLFKKPAH